MSEMLIYCNKTSFGNMNKQIGQIQKTIEELSIKETTKDCLGVK